MQKKDHPFKACTVYDPWMHSVDLMIPSVKPILSIQSSSFHWKENVSQMKVHFSRLVDKDTSKLIVITQSTHEDFSDFPILFPKITRNVKVRGERLSLHTKELYVQATVEFFAMHSTGEAFRDLKTTDYLNGKVDEILVDDAAITYLDQKSKALWNSK